MRYIRIIGCALAVMLLSGCVSKKAMDIPSDFWQTGEDKNIAVAFVQPPEMQAHRSGAEGLLDLAINEMVTDSVESHIQSLTHDKFEVGKSKVAKLIENRGSHSVIIPEYYKATDEHKLPKDELKKGYFDYDVSVVKDKYQATHLLVIQIMAAGTLRDYYGFIPLSKPRGYVNAEVTLVDLGNNKIVMEHRILEEVLLPEDVDWDDSDNQYPEITKVVNLALERAANRLPELL
ncbi:cytidine deaminase [Photobacterium sp. GB-27]|uniref:cytidine deaminase n=1 Tax=Photobacterium sp. GB-27 TaxID=2022109 RepID=UPI000D174088|nr:cytidine deaminase [Photobacterium sp. GB-27]PSV35355.1 cytidine deaminase [Photobacterium sp. GB-27]